MKQILIFILLIAIVFTYNGAYPRSKQSCQDKHVIGLFWDGQKCDVCANQYCYCSDYLGCDKCADGYSLYKFEHEGSRTKCYSCNQNSYGYVQECCFHGVRNEYDYQVNTMQTNKEKYLFTDDEETGYLISRAVKCQVYGNTDTKIETVEQFYNQNKWTRGVGQQRRYGSYCLYYVGCVAYNNYGQCFECAEGYYLNHHNDSQNVCVECPSGCKTCGTGGQCTSCQAGTFLKTQVKRIVIEGEALNTYRASVCEKCNEGCLCDGTILTKDGADIEQRCNLGCINTSYVLRKTEAPLDDVCVRCQDECKTCRLGTEAEGVETVCLSCHTTVPVNGSFYAEINNKNTCIKCPSNCHGCRLMPNGTQTTCLEGKCDNGYYPSVSKTNSRRSCKPCNIQNNTKFQYALRCDSEKLITQCQHDGTSQTITYQTVNPIEKKFQNIVHLVGEGENARCVVNNNKCKKIINNLTEGIDNLSCELCYQDKNYYISKLETNNKQVCIENFMTGCFTQISHQECTQCINQRDIGIDKNVVLNYYLNGKNCNRCPDGCLECINDSKCMANKCQSAYYYISTDQTCKKCTLGDKVPSLCDECTAEKCTSCFPRYALFIAADDSKYECLQCSDNCLECKMEKSGSDRRICTECDNGYYLASGTCYKKRSNCARQKDNGQCEFCEYGYRVVEGYCLLAIDTTAGYINVEYSCGTNHRVRDDGYLLNRAEFTDTYQPLSSNIVQFGFAMLTFIALFL